MGYGIKVTNENGNTLIDTELLSQMQTTEVTTLNGTSSTTIDLSRDFFLYNRTTTGNTALRQSVSNNVYSITNDSSTALNLLKLKIVTVIGNANQPTRAANDYGIEIKNSSGVISFTDLYSKGLTILSIYPPDTVSGGGLIYSGSTLSNIYVGAGGPYNSANNAYNNFYFDSSANKIYYRHFISFLGTSYNIVNDTTIVVAQVRN